MHSNRHSSSPKCPFAVIPLEDRGKLRCGGRQLGFREPRRVQRQTCPLGIRHYLQSPDSRDHIPDHYSTDTGCLYGCAGDAQLDVAARGWI